MAPSSIAHQGNEDHTHSSMMAWRVHEFGPPDVIRDASLRTTRWVLASMRRQRLRFPTVTVSTM
jgi:hypothetical protein